MKRLPNIYNWRYKSYFYQCYIVDLENFFFLIYCFFLLYYNIRDKSIHREFKYLKNLKLNSLDIP